MKIELEWNEHLEGCAGCLNYLKTGRDTGICKLERFTVYSWMACFKRVGKESAT